MARRILFVFVALVTLVLASCSSGSSEASWRDGFRIVFPTNATYSTDSNCTVYKPLNGPWWMSCEVKKPSNDQTEFGFYLQPSSMSAQVEPFADLFGNCTTRLGSYYGPNLDLAVFELQSGKRLPLSAKKNGAGACVFVVSRDAPADASYTFEMYVKDLSTAHLNDW